MKYFSIKKDILATLAYFNMFDYPLRKNEIFLFLGHSDDYSEFEIAFSTLIKESVIYKIGDFYSLRNNYALATRRYNGNQRAAAMLKKARRAAAIISAFPFVRGVGVSGSLSKCFADEHSDIDFFIITSANRLWIARSILHFFKKMTYLLNMQELFCMNYFIDEAEPVIPEKNIYTATEVATIMPLRGPSAFDKFFQQNNWAGNFFPNKHIFSPTTHETRKTWLKYLVEKILDNRQGNFLDNYLMKVTRKRWDSKTKSKKKDGKGLLLSMHVSKHFSKPNPEIFQRRLLYRYENNLAEIFKRYEISKIF